MADTVSLNRVGHCVFRLSAIIVGGKKIMKKLLFTKTLRMMIFLMFLLAIISLVLGQFTIRSSYRNEAERIEKNARQYFEMYNKSLKQLNAELLFVSINDANVRKLVYLGENWQKDHTTILNYYFLHSDIKDQLKKIVTIYGSKYYLWLYESETKSYIDYGINDYSHREEFKKSIHDQLAVDSVLQTQSYKWFVMDENYICTAFRYGTVYIGAWISIDDYFADIMRQPISSDYIVSMYDDHDNLIRCSENRDNVISVLEKDDAPDFNDYTIVISEKDINNNFTIKIKCLHKWYENSDITHMIIIFISLAILLCTFLFAYYLYRHILQPVIGFYNQIAVYSGKQKLRADSNVVELDSAANMVNLLMDEIHTLELEKYKQKIKLQEVELGFVQQQARPHFYINCLNVIYGMAQLNLKDGIQELCVNISDYMRYLFRKNMELVPVTQELDMINKYLSVMREVYDQKFIYETNVDVEIDSIAMPPLLIHTFIENSIKYGGCDDSLTVKVDVHIKDRYLQIRIQDSGIGFPPDILEAFRQKEIISKSGHKIGIMNVWLRLSLLYKEDYSLILENNETGAVVSIIIPAQTLKEC